MDKKIKYFAYGSNLSIEQMKERGIEVLDTELAELPGWRLTFTEYSETWKGGVGDIVPTADRKVEGVVYTLPEEDVVNLDHYEGRSIDDDMEVGMYRKQHLPVKKSSGWKTVLTYLVNRTEEYRSEVYLKPSKEYMETIIRGAEEHGLSDEYIDLLKDIECD
ncbi:MAG: gamma-glutamylcyclotransferase family protein [Candidatus Natronoplasma sp.]